MPASANPDHGPSINFAISAHGYGHLTQAVAVARALLKANPDTRLRFQCALPRSVIGKRLGSDVFDHDRRACDIGLVQPDPLTCDIGQTTEAYHQLHQDFARKVHAEGQNLADWGADILIADIPYLSIAAAADAGIPSIAIASLSWDKVVAAYFDLNDQAPGCWHADIRSAYADTSLALLPEPALAGACFAETRPIPPIAIAGNRLPDLRQQLGIADHDQRPLILCSLGGIAASKLPLSQMQQDPRFHWLVNAGQLLPAANLHSLDALDSLSYQDILASVDGLVSKPGYGTAVEAVVNQLPFVYTSRGHFPDEAVIMDWLEHNGRCRHISRRSWQNGQFGDHLQQLLEQKAGPAVVANGAELAASIIQDYL